MGAILVARNGNVELHKETRHDESGIARERLEFGARLKATRLAAGLTLEECAFALGIGKRSQSAYEDGSRAPDVDYLQALQRVLGVDLQVLVAGVPRAKGGGLVGADADHIERLQALPPKIRRTVEDVLLLAYMANQDRDSYPK